MDWIRMDSVTMIRGRWTIRWITNHPEVDYMVFGLEFDMRKQEKVIESGAISG